MLYQPYSSHPRSLLIINFIALMNPILTLIILADSALVPPPIHSSRQPAAWLAPQRVKVLFGGFPSLHGVPYENTMEE